MHVLIGSTNGYLCVNVLNKYYDQSVRVQSFDLSTEKNNQTRARFANQNIKTFLFSCCEELPYARLIICQARY